MNGIVLMPSPTARAELVTDGVPRACCVAGDGNLKSLMTHARRHAGETFGAGPAFLAVHAPFGGDAFSGPARIDQNVLSILDDLSAQAPAHVPATLAAARAALEFFPETPAILVSETAFFVRLPRRESAYGLNADLMRRLHLRRTGYHGIFHEASYGHARRVLRSPRRGGPVRVLSICLELKPEVAAVANGRPVMVTGGATPLEGLPGETSCGEIDAALPLALMEHAGLGPQEIGHILARGSGLRGLTGRAMTFPEVFRCEAPECAAARDFFHYRLLLACGAGLAALSGLDGIVFSGRYAKLGAEIGPSLIGQLHRAMRSAGPPPKWIVFADCLAKLIADQALRALRPAVV